MYWKCVPTFWRNVFSPSSGCLVDVVAEVVGRKECVIYIGNFEKLLADRRWNGACTEIMGITSASTESFSDPEGRGIVFPERRKSPSLTVWTPLPNTIIWEIIWKPVLFTAHAIQRMCSMWSKVSGLTLVLSFIYCAFEPVITLAVLVTCRTARGLLEIHLGLSE